MRTLKPDSTYPLRAPAWTKGIVATGTVLFAEDIQGDMIQNDFKVESADHIGYGTYSPQVSATPGLVAGEACDVMVLSRYESCAVIQWAPPNGIDPVLRQWLMSSDHGLHAVPAGKAMRRGDPISVAAVFYPEGGLLNVEFEVTRPHAGMAKVCSFAYSIGTPFVPPSPWVVEALQPGAVTQPGPESRVLRALMEQRKEPPIGAVSNGSYPVVIRSRQIPPWRMVCPDGVERDIPAIPKWLAERDNQAPVWSYGGHEYVELPTGLLFRRNPSAPRPYWEHLAAGEPSLFS